MKILFFFIVFPLVLFGVDFTDFDRYQGKCHYNQLNERWEKYLKKDPSLAAFVTLTEEALIIHDENRKTEYILELLPKEIPLKREKKKGLRGAKIAIDPGHFGGPYARLERRYIDIQPSLENRQFIRFDEGTLAFLTALHLKALLEKEGAIVFLTRKEIGKGALEEDFFAYLKNRPELWEDKAPLELLFKGYNLEDLRERVKKINAFGPDLSVMIHYNSHHGEGQDTSNSAVTKANFNMVFVPGAFCRGELRETKARYELLRLLLSDHLDESIRFSRSILESFTETLSVPVVTASDGARYLPSVCLKVEEGIYARNLALTRGVHSPICYGETLVQNNIDESANLARTDWAIAGVKTSSRVKEVAEAYFIGIKRAFEPQSESGQIAQQ